MEPVQAKKEENSATKLDVIAEDYDEVSNHGYGFDDYVNYEEMTGSVVNNLVTKDQEKRISLAEEKAKATNQFPGLRRQATRDTMPSKNFESDVVTKAGRRTNVQEDEIKELNRKLKNREITTSLSSFASSEDSSIDSSEDSDSNEQDNDTGVMVEVFVRSVRLPDFLLTHHEYSSTQVPQIKNF